ncbi:MAG: thiamine-phosphate kinase [Deltaproteobacteria bacterium]|nr:thiamine-phosphate kinase [Deltaproteobacteria bacterium]
MPPPETLTSEWDLIAALSREFGPAPAGVILGIGDDCAALAGNGPDYLLWTMDTLVEGVHFDLVYTSLAQLGWKSLTVNLSDIAAMGGDPGPALLSLGWPKGRDRSLALEFAAGLAQAAREYGVAVIGGDTVASPGGLIVTVTLTGRVPADQMLRRTGAGVGDLIFVTGPLGEAAAGLKILRQGLDLPPDLQEALTEAQLRPRPLLRAGRLLAREGLATALIDTSDGIATDLYHICRASGVGARIPAAAVPVSPRVTAAAPHLGCDPLDLALFGGEDYLLLFTAKPAVAKRLPASFSRAGLAAPLPLGHIVTGDRVILLTPAGEKDISGQGYDHFRLDLEGDAQ